MSMRLLLVSAAHHPNQGGIGTAISILVQNAMQAGWHVELITRQSEYLPECSRFHVVHTRDEDPEFSEWVGPLRSIHRIRPYRYGLWSLAVARKLLKLHDAFDAIGFVDSQAEGYVALTSRRVRRHWCGTPMYVHAHTPMWMVEENGALRDAQFGRSIYHDWERRAIAAADGLCAPSQLLLDRLQPCQRGTVIPHMLPVTDTHRAEPQQVCLCIGNVESNKGVETWARSLNRVFEQCSQATACLIGRDTPTAPSGGSMAEQVLSFVNSKFRNQFHWKDRIAHEALQDLMARAALLVVPSRFESFSYAAAEAIIRQVPVVITDQVGIGEYVPDLVKIPVGDSEALALAQLEVLHNQTLASARARRCREQLVAACGPDRALDLFGRFIRSLSPCGEIDNASADSLEQMADFLQSIENCASMPTRNGAGEPQAAAELS